MNHHNVRYLSERRDQNQLTGKRLRRHRAAEVNALATALEVMVERGLILNLAEADSDLGRCLTPQELAHAKQAKSELEKAARRVRAIGKRMMQT